MHARHDGPAHLALAESRQTDGIQCGQGTVTDAIGGGEARIPPAWQLQALGQRFGHRDIGGAGIEQEGHRLIIDRTGGHEVP